MQKVTNKILLIILFFSVITVSFAGGLEDKANKIVYEKELDFKNYKGGSVNGFFYNQTA